MAKREDCIFCKIVAGEIPGELVYADDDIVAFRDIQPQAPVHILIIPRRHIPSLHDARPDDASVLGAIQLVARSIAGAEGLGESGYRLVVNIGRDGGQTVRHIHYHLLGGRALTWPPG